MAGSVDKLQEFLDGVISPSSQKCPLNECTAGKVWLVLAGLSLAGAAYSSWNAFLSTLAYEAIIGLGVAYLCRSCHSTFLWIMLLIFMGLPVVAIGSILFFFEPTVDVKTH
jgi:hypothetical protein